ncbi:hypothetical protein [Streptosporangium sp. NPDC048865]|uniref:hypothetical protein n=1 Tax=Streptosporangium sp. NPDC048865 TaxID=3155766 RepID=UPI00343B59E0
MSSAPADRAGGSTPPKVLGGVRRPGSGTVKLGEEALNRQPIEFFDTAGCEASTPVTLAGKENVGSVR